VVKCQNICHVLAKSGQTKNKGFNLRVYFVLWALETIIFSLRLDVPMSVPMSHANVGIFSLLTNSERTSMKF